MDKLANKVLGVHALLWVCVVLVLLGNDVYASDKTEEAYIVASIGRSEYPFKAFDQVSMPNTENNQNTMWSLGVGWKAHKNVAVELGYYDFGDVSANGCYAEEPGVSGWDGPGLNYDDTFCAHSWGFAKGTALTVVPQTTVAGYTLFARYGIIRAKSMWARSAMPKSGESATQLNEATTGNYPIVGVGVGRGNVRAEYILAEIQPHGESAFGNVRAVMLSFLF